MNIIVGVAFVLSNRTLTPSPPAAFRALRSDLLPQSADLSRSGSAEASGGLVSFRPAGGWASVSRQRGDRRPARELIRYRLKEVAHLSAARTDPARHRGVSAARHPCSIATRGRAGAARRGAGPRGC